VLVLEKRVQRRSRVAVLKPIEMGRGAQVAWGFAVEQRGEGAPGPAQAARRGGEIRTRGSTFGEDGENTGGPAARRRPNLSSQNRLVGKVKSRREGTTKTQECSRRALTPAASGRVNCPLPSIKHVLLFPAAHQTPWVPTEACLGNSGSVAVRTAVHSKVPRSETPVIDQSRGTSMAVLR
jgi:hypothetical protein